MSVLRWAVSAWRNLRHRGQAQDELGEELDAYVELLVEERVKAGLSPAAARRAARIAVGSLDGVKEDVQAVRAGAFAESVLLDVRHAIRALSRSPVFTATAVLVLALGIGANALVFGVIDTVFFRGPAHVRDPGRVARVALVATIPGEGVFTTIARTYRDYESLRDRGTAFSSVAAFATMPIVVGQGAAAEEVSATVATHTFFPLLGVQPRLGRFYGADEDRPGGPPVAVLGYGYWCRRYGCAPTVLGQSLLVRGRPYTIVGVAPQGFTGVALEAPDAWLPVATAGPDVLDYGGAISGFLNAWLVLVVRLKPGVSTALAEQVAVAAVRWSGDDARVGGGGRQYRVQLHPIQESRGPTRRPEALVLVWVGAVSVLILLIACANVASLLLTRALNRQREIAVRLVLGIPRRRLVQQLVVESVILAAIGASAGSLIVLLGGPAFRRLALGGMAAAQPFGTWRLLLFVTTLTLATGLATGLVPGLQATRGNLTSSLGSGVREVGRRYARTLRGLLLAQVALSFILLVMAGLFVQSLRAAQRIDLGLDPQGLLSIKLDVRPDALPRPETRAAYQRLLVFVETLPLVQHAALAASEPLGASMSVSVRLPGRRVAPELERSSQYCNLVSQDYFPTVGMPILRGRGFSADDVRDHPTVAVVGGAFARAFWPGEDPLGQCFVVFPDEPGCLTVVGVTTDVPTFGITREPLLMAYVPLPASAAPYPEGALYVRTVGPAADAIPMLRQAIAGSGAEVPFARISRVSERVEVQLRPWQLGRTMFGVYGLLALVLTGCGLYGVLGYSVAQRTPEIGLRMALGAAPSAVVLMILRESLIVVAGGVAIGGATALAAGHAVASLIYGISARDAGTFALVALLLVSVTLIASYFPARHATKVDPMVALRCE